MMHFRDHVDIHQSSNATSKLRSGGITEVPGIFWGMSSKLKVKIGPGMFQALHWKSKETYLVYNNTITMQEDETRMMSLLQPRVWHTTKD